METIDWIIISHTDHCMQLKLVGGAAKLSWHNFKKKILYSCSL